MMEIRVRHHTDSESRVLADVPFRPDVIDKIIPTLGGWGIAASDGNLYSESDLMGQFVDDGHEAYFEVIIGADD